MTASRSVQGVTAEVAFTAVEGLPFRTEKEARDTIAAVQQDVVDHVHEHQLWLIRDGQAQVAQQAQILADGAELLSGLDSLAAQAADGWTPEVARQWGMADSAAQGIEEQLLRRADLADALADRLADPLASLSRLQAMYAPLRGIYGQQVSVEGLDRLTRAFANTPVGPR